MPLVVDWSHGDLRLQIWSPLSLATRFLLSLCSSSLVAVLDQGSRAPSALTLDRATREVSQSLFALVQDPAQHLAQLAGSVRGYE